MSDLPKDTGLGTFASRSGLRRHSAEESARPLVNLDVSEEGEEGADTSSVVLHSDLTSGCPAGGLRRPARARVEASPTVLER